MKQLPIATPKEANQWAFNVLKKHKREFALLCAVFCIFTLLGLIGPQILGAIVESVSKSEGTNRIDLLALAFLLTLIGYGIFKWLMETRSRQLSEQIIADTRENLVANVLELPLSTVEDTRTGDLLNRANDDVNAVSATLRLGGPEILAAIFSIVFITVAMLVTSPLLSLGLLVSFPLSTGCTIWILRRDPLVRLDVSEKSDVLHSHLHETAAGSRTIEALGISRKRQKEYVQIDTAHVFSNNLRRRIYTTYIFFFRISYLLPPAVFLLLGYWAFSQGWAELGTITTMLLYSQALAIPIHTAASWLNEMTRVSVSLRRILGVRTRRAAVKYFAAPKRQQITLSDVHFGYSSDREVLHGINLEIPQGERLAIVGPSGAGKTTLARLLAGIVVPTSGSVRIGEAEVSQLDSDVLRQEILLLTQEHHIFTGTVRENLALPAGKWTDSDLLAALETVELRRWLATLPEGLNTQIGSGAIAVPAGIAQQIAMARVVLANPHTVVLDEATSLLDTSAARDLERSLNAALRGRTVIAIAHRLHTSAAADRVVVIEHGQIVETGAPATLRNADGPYGRLVRAAEKQTSLEK